MDNIFGEAMVPYTRTQAIADGLLVDVTQVGGEAGFRWPLAVSKEVWGSCVAVPTDCEGLQDEDGRLWDVVSMASQAWRDRVLRAGIRLKGRTRFHLHVVQERHHLARTPPLVDLDLVVGPGDDGEPVMTVLLPHED